MKRVPNGGLSPQVIVGFNDCLCLIYVKGDPSHGDIFYVRSDDAGTTFTAPIRVNSQAGSAVVIGTVRSPQIAVGRGGRVYVAWVGSSEALPRAVTPLDNKTPMLFARLNDAGTEFEPQRNLISEHAGLDGGGSVAADLQGHVFVVWHAPIDTPGDAGRCVWLARSSDDGKTFDPEILASSNSAGACGCCGLKAIAAPTGELYIAYRTAAESVHRDMTVLDSVDFGRSFKSVFRDPWNANVCVMSTSAVALSPNSQTHPSAIAAWETRGQIRYERLSDAVPAILDIPGHAERKHPAIAINKTGDFLIVWAEGTGWNKGGRIAWQLFDRTGRPTQAGAAKDLPVWSQPTVYAKPDGSFGIIY